jgi:hexokinase
MMNILDAFAMSPSDCRDLAACMCETMEAGLSGPSEMRMLPSYVCAMPTGDEEVTNARSN